MLVKLGWYLLRIIYLSELRTIVEFLNVQMDPAEVFVVELKQYVGEGLKTLVPRLVGQTAEAQMRKVTTNKKLDETSFFEHLDEKETIFYKQLLEYAKQNQLSISWGSKSFSINIVKDGNNINLLRGFCNLSAFGHRTICNRWKYINESS